MQLSNITRVLAHYRLTRPSYVAHFAVTGRSADSASLQRYPQLSGNYIKSITDHADRGQCRAFQVGLHTAGDAPRGSPRTTPRRSPKTRCIKPLQRNAGYRTSSHQLCHLCQAARVHRSGRDELDAPTTGYEVYGQQLRRRHADLVGDYDGECSDLATQGHKATGIPKCICVHCWRALGKSRL